MPWELEPLVEDVLDAAGAGRAGRVRHGRILGRIVAVTVVDAADVVRGGEHVVVEHHVDLLDLRVAEVLGVVARADETVLLGAEPHEPHLLTQVVPAAGELLGLGQQRGGAGAVVVDARALGHRVQVRARDHDVVRVAAARLGDHLVQEARLVETP